MGSGRHNAAGVVLREVPHNQEVDSICEKVLKGDLVIQNSTSQIIRSSVRAGE
jgi:hypothetical protein